MSQINKPPHSIPKQQAGSTAKYKNVPKPYLDVAKGMEKQFINYMVTQMRNSVKSETPESSGEKYYKSLMDNQRAEIISDTKNGIGLKDMILDQILPNHLKQQVHVKPNALASVKMYQQEADSKREN
jgi:Rod binding domain-containing protein